MTKQQEHATIDAAILAAQSSFKAVKKSAENTHFKNKYSTLEDDIDAVKEALWAHGVTYHFEMDASEMGYAVTTILTHPASNSARRTSVPLVMGKQDMQQLKSATTYARRIGIEFLTGIAPSDDDDAEGERKGNTMGAALADAWKQAVLDNLPENATPRQKAEGFAAAICRDFKDKTGIKALNNSWDKRKGLIESMQQRFPDLAEKVVDAFENRKNDLEEAA